MKFEDVLQDLRDGAIVKSTKRISCIKLENKIFYWCSTEGYIEGEIFASVLTDMILNDNFTIEKHPTIKLWLNIYVDKTRKSGYSSFTHTSEEKANNASTCDTLVLRAFPIEIPKVSKK